MRAGLVDGIARGHLFPWASMVLLWGLLVLGLFLGRRGRARSGRVLLVLGAVAAVSLVGHAAATALAIPRVRWRAVDGGALVPGRGAALQEGGAASGVATWRSLHGPAVAVEIGGEPDVAVPVVDEQGRWVLAGLLSGRAVEGLAPAPAVQAEASAPRLCPSQGGACRAWPEGWPAPTAASARDLVWSKEALGALAFDVESGRYLRGVAEGRGGPALELLGDVSAGAGRGDSFAVQVFALRRLAGGRLSGVRVVARQRGGEGMSFALERAEVSVVTGPLVLAIVTPGLLLGMAGLPLGIVAFVVAPGWLARWLRRRGAVRRVLGGAMTVDWVAVERGGQGDQQRVRLARVRDDVDLGDALLPQGAVVQVGAAPWMEGAMTGVVWYELPAGEGGMGLEEGVPGADAAVSHGERGVRRKVGVLVPGDAGAFSRVARGWMGLMVHPVAVMLGGVVAAMPGVVGVVMLVASR